MSDPTILTTVTADAAPGASKAGMLSRLTSKMPAFLWLVVIVLVVGLILLFMWQRGDRLALVMIRRNQMNYVRRDACAAMIEESIMEYDRQRHQLAEPRVTDQAPSPLDEVEQQQDLGSEGDGNNGKDEDYDDDYDEDYVLSEEEDEESTSEEEEEEEDEEEEDEEPPTLPATKTSPPPPPKDKSSSGSGSSESESD